MLDAHISGSKVGRAQGLRAYPEAAAAGKESLGPHPDPALRQAQRFRDDDLRHTEDAPRPVATRLGGPARVDEKDWEELTSPLAGSTTRHPSNGRSCPSPASGARMMAWTRSAYCSLVILDHGLFVSVPNPVEGRLIEVPSDELQPYRKPGDCGPTRYREARMARQVGRSCIAG
jgi:hypothetical protein